MYALALWQGWRDRVLPIPLAAVVLNASWELVFAFRHPPARRSTRLMYRLWFFLDLALLALALLWTAPPIASLSTRGTLIVIALGAFALAAVAHEYLYARLRAPEIEAFALNLIMSALFCARLADHPDPSAPTLAIALLKAAGTGAISLANLIDGAAWSPRRRPLLFLIPAILLLDAIYIAALW